MMYFKAMLKSLFADYILYILRMYDTKTHAEAWTDKARIKKYKYTDAEQLDIIIHITWKFNGRLL